MTPPDALRRRAERAAAAVISQHDLAALGVAYDVLVAVVAVGWLEGYDASHVATRVAISDTLAAYTHGPWMRAVTP